MNDIKTYASGTVAKHTVVCVEMRTGKWLIEFCDEGSVTADESLEQAKALGMTAKKVVLSINIPSGKIEGKK